MDKMMMQTVVFVLKDGRKASFTGPAQLGEGDTVMDWYACEPTELPDGCYYETQTELKVGSCADGAR